jgi:hypothetical protein
LRRRAEPRRFEAILFADARQQTQAELDFIRDDVVAELLGSPTAFGMTPGDTLFDDLSLFPRHRAVVARLGIPWYHVPGNHEMNPAAADDRHDHGVLEIMKSSAPPPDRLHYPE